MQIKIGCTDGKTYVGDHASDAEIQAELDRLDGRIGTGDLSDVICKTPKEFADWFSDFLGGKEIKGMTVTEATLVIDGKDRKFKPSAIVWHEIVMDDE